MKKILSFILVTIMLFTCTACSGGDKPSIQPTPSSSQVVTSPTTDSKESPTNDSTEITMETLLNHKESPAEDFEYEDAEEAEGIKITKYNGNDVIVVIPKTISGKTVVELKVNLFANESNVKGVLIPDSVKELKYTFINNDDIQVVICEGVEALKDATALNCASLHTLVLGDQLSEMGKFCIAGCPKLKEVYISDKVTNIEQKLDSYDVLNDCPSLTVIGKAGSYIETYAKENNIPFRVK